MTTGATFTHPNASRRSPHTHSHGCSVPGSSPARCISGVAEGPEAAAEPARAKAVLEAAGVELRAQTRPRHVRTPAQEVAVGYAVAEDLGLTAEVEEEEGDDADGGGNGEGAHLGVGCV
jgi:hypothetical protein